MWKVTLHLTHTTPLKMVALWYVYTALKKTPNPTLQQRVSEPSQLTLAYWACTTELKIAAKIFRAGLEPGL